MLSKVKQLLYDYCCQYVENRIARIGNEIKVQQEAANEETKSSAGDKYETGRAMAQSDIERNVVQLKEAEKLKATLQRIAQVDKAETVISGSLVTTSKGVYYISIGLGAVKIEGKEYFLITPSSPIGKLLMNKRVGEEIVWREQKLRIQVLE
jgi:transcription elongation GreA/GreB family factor